MTHPPRRDAAAPQPSERDLLAVLVPGVGAAVHLALRRPGDRYETLRVGKLTARTGIDPFFGGSVEEKRAMIELPAPRTPHRLARR